MKTKKLEAFIASVKAENKNENIEMLNKMEEIKANIPKMLENGSSENCKQEILYILDGYFKNNIFTEKNNIEHEKFRKKIIDSDVRDRELFLHFFDFVKCKVNDCNYTDKSTEQIEGSRMNLRKKNGDEIILLDLFSFSKNVSIIMNDKETSYIEIIKNIIINGFKIAVIITTIVLTSFIIYNISKELYNLLFKNKPPSKASPQNTQPTTSPDTSATQQYSQSSSNRQNNIGGSSEILFKMFEPENSDSGLSAAYGTYSTDDTEQKQKKAVKFFMIFFTILTASISFILYKYNILEDFMNMANKIMEIGITNIAMIFVIGDLQ